LISKPAYATPEARKALVRRLREGLVKDVPVVGVCKPLEAIFRINEVERAEDKDYSFSRCVLGIIRRAWGYLWAWGEVGWG
jgi:hypothetical protein